MNRDEIKAILKKIKTAYPNFTVDSDVVDLWADMLPDVTTERAEKNLRYHIQTNRYPPTIADVRGGDEHTPPPIDPGMAELIEIAKQKGFFDE